MFFSHEGGKKWGHTYCLALSDLAEMYSFLNFYLLLCYWIEKKTFLLTDKKFFDAIIVWTQMPWLKAFCDKSSLSAPQAELEWNGVPQDVEVGWLLQLADAWSFIFVCWLWSNDWKTG